MSDIDVKREFAKRERKVTLIVFVAFLLFGGVAGINHFTSIDINIAFPFLLGAALCVFGFYKFYRCPKCNSVPPALGQEGVQISPKECGRCGAKLR
jgi:hypothetical protein